MAASPTPETVEPRLFLADVRLSALIPNAWTLREQELALPKIDRPTTEGRTATIHFEVAPQLNPDRMSEELPIETLREFARRDIAARDPQTRIMASEDRTITGRQAFEVTWQKGGSEGEMIQALYFYIEDRFVILSLHSSRADFPTLVPEYQTWLLTLRGLSQRDSGALDTPSRGGLYLNLAARIRIPVPDTWLIGVANDHTFGATLVDGDRHASWTITAGPRSSSGVALTSKIRKDAKASITARSLRVMEESEDPFHGYPALTLNFDGYKGNRFIKGQDLWVWSPAAQWLISMEGDGPLVNRLRTDYRKMLDALEFL